MRLLKVMKKYLGSISNNKGFTLIEVIVATLILTFVTGASYTMLHSGIQFTSRQTTQTELRNDARQVLNEIVKKIQEADPNVAFLSYPAYVQNGFLTGSVSSTSESAISSEITIRNNIESVRYWYSSSEKTIYKEIDGVNPHIFLRDVESLEFIFNKNDHKLDYTIQSEVKYKQDSVAIDLQAVPRLIYRYVDLLYIAGSPTITIPTSNTVSSEYQVIVFDQNGSNYGNGSWLAHEIISGSANDITVTTSGNYLTIVVEPNAVNGTVIRLHAESVELDGGGYKFANYFDVTLRSPEDEGDGSTTLPPFSLEDLWVTQGNQWIVDYSENRKRVHQKSSGNHIIYYNVVYGNFEFSTNITIDPSSSRSGRYGLLFGSSSDTNKKNNNNNYLYAELNSNNSIDIKYKPTNQSAILLASNFLSHSNSSSTTLNLKVVLNNGELTFFSGTSLLSTTPLSYSVNTNYLGFKEEGKGNSPNAVYEIVE